jgi:TolB protein
MAVGGLLVISCVSPAGASFPGDAGRIAFVGKRDGRAQLYTMTRSGGAVRRLTDSKRSEGSPSFSPDGRWILLSREFKRDQYDIVLMRADGTHMERLTSRKARDLYPSWSPDGEQIVYSREVWPGGRFDLFVMDRTGEGRIRVTSTEDREFHAIWSPDGDRIAYVSGNRGLHTIDTDGSDEVAVAGWASDADWTPDGDGFVVTGYGPDGEGIYAVDELGTVSTPVSLGAGWFAPIWSPTGNEIVVQNFGVSGHKPGFYRMNADGSDVKFLRSSSIFARVSWQTR